MSNVSKDFNSRYQQSKLSLSSYMKKFESYYPSNYSDIMFLQNFNIVNSALRLKKESEEYLSNLMDLNKNFSSNSKETYQGVYNHLAELVHEIKNKSAMQNISDISERFVKFEKLVEENMSFNKAYVTHIENTTSTIDNLDYVANKQYGYLNYGSNAGNVTGKNSIDVVGGKLKISANPSTNNTPLLSKNSSKKNIHDLKRKDTIDNQSKASSKAGRVNKSRSVIATKKGSISAASEYNPYSPLTIRKDIKFDVRLFNLSYIHYINTHTFKWEDFISFANSPNEQILQNKLFLKEMQFKNLVCPDFLKLIENYSFKMQTERSCSNGKQIMTKTISQFGTIEDEYQDYLIKPIEGTSYLQITTNSKVFKMKVDLEKVQEEYREKMILFSALSKHESELEEAKLKNLSTISAKLRTGNFMSIANDEIVNENTELEDKRKTEEIEVFKGEGKEKKERTDDTVNKEIQEMTVKKKTAKSIKLSISADKEKSVKLTDKLKSPMSHNHSTSSIKQNTSYMSNISKNKESPYFSETKASLVPPYLEFPFGIKTLTIGHEVYFIGGKAITTEYPTVLCFNIKTRELHFVTNMIYKRSYTALYHDEHYIYIVGGEYNITCEFLNLNTARCTSLPNLTQPKANSILYIYKHTIMYSFCGFKAEISNPDKNNELETVERIILRKEPVIKLGIHNFYWDRVECSNLTGIDIKLEVNGITPVTDNYIMLHGGYSSRKNKRVMLMFDIIKHEIHCLSPDIIRKLKQDLMKS
eukprot:CAMPEP_0170522344 /NCGR_PEP_ID=MMETSP0209-20121228/7770_1 /TAXON_ID=665100 ORGANISM="Litonotus pictus, Strain P1" /NCGR_SAMPLE_ID=MMETSP0209 /ASSEMBLY_ACC=CAM_ASM_000301 /LENGTH=756 /DNA_ID=CAMNT_0010809797 /DNA_START=357 /DNA_END=2624 /DNA_ORIENTATION=+